MARFSMLAMLRWRFITASISSSRTTSSAKLDRMAALSLSNLRGFWSQTHLQGQTDTGSDLAEVAVDQCRAVRLRLYSFQTPYCITEIERPKEQRRHCFRTRFNDALDQCRGCSHCGSASTSTNTSQHQVHAHWLSTSKMIRCSAIALGSLQGEEVETHSVPKMCPLLATRGADA